MLLRESVASLELDVIVHPDDGTSSVLEDSKKTDSTERNEEASEERAYYDHEDDDGRHAIGLL